MKFESFESKNAYTGKQFEEELLAEVTCGWKGEEWIQADSKNKNEIMAGWLKEHLPDITEKQWRFMRPEERRDHILNWAKDHQPEHWNPSDPLRYKDLKPGEEEKEPQIDNKTMANLHTFVAESLGLEDYDELKLCTTLHTPADTLYGIDGFFEWKGIVFSIDVTVNQSKIDNGVALEKADWVLALNNPEDEQELEDQAKRIARSMKLKIEMTERRKGQQRAA